MLLNEGKLNFFQRSMKKVVEGKPNGEFQMKIFISSEKLGKNSQILWDSLNAASIVHFTMNKGTLRRI